MKIKFYSTSLLAVLMMTACGSDDSGETAENSNQDPSTVEVIEDDAESANYVDQEVLPYTLSAELREDFILKSSEVREPRDGVLTCTLFNYSLEESNEIAFMFTSTVFSEAARDIEDHFASMKSNPRPNSERESINLIEINDEKWVHDIYITPGDPSDMKVHNLVHINGAKMLEVIIVTDEPVYTSWEDAIVLCIETLKLL